MTIPASTETHPPKAGRRLAEGSGRNGRPSVFYQIVPAMLEKKTSRQSNARVLDRELFIAIHIPILD